MARKYLMSWEGKPNFRWVKMHKGIRHRVTCAELNLSQSEWTQEASYQAANAWWMAANVDPVKQAMATTVGSVPVDKLQAMIEAGQAAQAILTANGDPDTLIAEADGLIDGVVAENFDDAHRINILHKIGEKIGTTGAKGFQLEAHAAEFLKLEQAKGKKPRTYGELSSSINAIIKTTYEGKPLLSPLMDVREIDETTVKNFYLFLRNESKRAAYQQKKQFEYFKRLVKSLWSARLIDLPRNLDGDWDFNVKHKKVKEYQTAEIVALLGKLPPRLKLYALLGLNCGMLSVDVSSLRKDQIDMKAGRIKRKRTKEEDEETTPEVDYLLWPETLRLLKQCLSADPVLALTTSAGTPLVRAWIENGSEKVVNMLRQQWKRAGTKIPHKAFRSIGSTLLYNNPLYRGWTGYYLGHSRKSLIEKHYAADTAEGRKEFDAVVTWLGKQFGLA